MALREAWWQPHETLRPDCRVSVNRWGDGVNFGGTTWRAVHLPTGAAAYIAFDRLVADGDALAQLFVLLDARLDERSG